MSFQDVVPGEERQAESAARYNAVNQLLRRSFSGSGDFGQHISGRSVEFCNISTQVIPCFAAVSVTGTYSGSEVQWHWSRPDGHALVCGVPAENELQLWGISMDEVAPGEFGTLIVSGLAPAYFPAGCRQVSPSPSGLNAGNGAEVVADVCEYAGGESLPGIILLGRSRENSAYNGVFKLQRVSSTELEIVYGRDPERNYCGFTDVPGWDVIPKTKLILPENKDHLIYLTFFYDPDARVYSAEFLTEIPDEAVFYRNIGTFRNGMVSQALDIGSSETLIFGNEWYLS